MSCQKTAVVAMYEGEKCIWKEQGGDKQWLRARTREVFIDIEGKKQMWGIYDLEQIELDA